MVPWPEVLAAFAIIRLVSAIPITPGGLGIAELGLVGMVSTGMAEPGVERVAAAILLFRFFTYLLPTIVGGAVAYGWHRTNNRATGAARWGLDEVPADHLEGAVCFRCGLPGERHWDLDPFALVECPSCGQAFMSPRLNEAGRMALYGNAKYFDDGVYRSTGAQAMQRRWSSGRLDLIERHLGGRDDRRIFEVGCAYGMFLEAARDRGFGLGGLEYSAVAAAKASERLGVNIHVGEVVSLPATEDYDSVAFWDVIEHVPDPGAFLAAAAGLTKPGGVLAFSCPNFDSLPARLLRTKWWTLKPHKHIWHFRKKDLRRMVREAGLEMITIVTNPARRANWVRLDSLVVVARKP
jgi:2-polyprenyl-3-methyl-5-hydroxy-6-metoxy-1,4-benzoquinol methylase